MNDTNEQLQQRTAKIQPDVWQIIGINWINVTQSNRDALWFKWKNGKSK